MGIRNYNWLNAQASRRYPLDDNSTGTGDDGTRLKDDIIVDLHLRWPRIAGQYAFLSGLTVTENIVTAVILAADSPDAAANFVPLASVTVRQPATEYSYHALNALYPGVGGFIAFGDTSEGFSIRFSTPRQGLISPKTAHPYDLLPIPTIKKFGRADSLTGIVKILPGPDLEIVKETVMIETEEVDAIVIRLQSPTSERNPLADYIGPCGTRPESQNCDRPGIQTINGVSPDCNGNIEIEFPGTNAETYRDCGGITLDQSVGIQDVCPNADEPGRFAGEDDCHPTSDSSMSISEGSESEPGTPSSDSESSEAIPCEDLPFRDCFDEAPHPSWIVKLGLSRLIAADSPVEPCLIPRICVEHHSGISSVSLSSSEQLLPWSSESSYDCPYAIDQAVQLYDNSRRNVMIWDDCGTGNSLGKIVRTQLQLVNSGSQHNAGVVMNYQLIDPFTNPRIIYWLAQINRNSNRVELLRFNGSILVPENFVTPAVPFSFDDWYEVKATITPAGANATIAVRVSNVSTPGWPVVSFSLTTNRWGLPAGRFGIHTTNASANFSFWELSDV